MAVALAVEEAAVALAVAEVAFVASITSTTAAAGSIRGRQAPQRHLYFSPEIMEEPMERFRGVKPAGGLSYNGTNGRIPHDTGPTMQQVVEVVDL